LWFAKIEREIARGIFTSVQDLRRKLPAQGQAQGWEYQDQELGFWTPGVGQF